MKQVRENISAHDERENKLTDDTKDNVIQKNTNGKNYEETLQWHPAFYADVQIELEGELGNLVFENEHQLGTMPKEIDILIIKKNKYIPIKKNIGWIFRKYNIVEYKSPEDSLGINDFYKVLGYMYFYKADTRNQNYIKLQDITITFVCKRYPRGVIRHLKKENDTIEKVDDGIFYVKGEKIPIQIIVTSQLSEEKNFWLKNLTNDLKDEKTAERLIQKYRVNKDDIYYKSVMDIIVRANKNLFEEGNPMCDALLEMYNDQLMARCREIIMKEEAQELEKIKQQGIEQGRQQGIEQGRQQGIEQGRQQERKNTEAERARAEKAERYAGEMESENRRLRELLRKEGIVSAY